MMSRTIKFSLLLFVFLPLLAASADESNSANSNSESSAKTEPNILAISDKIDELVVAQLKKTQSAAK